MPGPTQLRVRQTMLDAGGYWRPLAAVARLLEELGELSELLARPHPPQRELAGELADLGIITTALGDQYLAEAEEPPGGEAGVGYTGAGAGGAGAGGGASSPRPAAEHLPSLTATVAAAGEIARVVNYYDGPKTPRSAAALPSLAAALARFHERLVQLAAGLGIELAEAVDGKLRTIRARDMERFDRADCDPSTAPVLERLRAAEPQALEWRLWGAPPEGADHALRAFLRACGPERLDAFVLGDDSADGGETTGGAVALIHDDDRLPDGVELEALAGFLLLRRRVLARPGGDLP